MTKSGQKKRRFYVRLQRFDKLLTWLENGFIIQNIKGNDKEPVKSEKTARESLRPNTCGESDT